MGFKNIGEWIMNKPKKQTVSHYNYSECAKYIGHKLGYDINNVNNNFDDYKNFWHILVDRIEPKNGSYICLSFEDGLEDLPEWSHEIVELFWAEFGRYEEYWLEW